MQNKIKVKQKDINMLPYEAIIEFDFTYNEKRGSCKYQVYDTDTTDNQAGILILEYDETGEEDIFQLIHDWVDEHIEFIPKIIYKPNKQ